MSMATCPCSIGVTADAAQPTVRRRAVIRDPLVVEPRESRSEIRVFEAGHAQPEAGIEHHRVDVVAVGVAHHTLGRPAVHVGGLADSVLGRATGAGALVLRIVAALEHQPQPPVGTGFHVIRPAFDRLDRQRGVLGDVSIGIDDSHVSGTYSRGLSGQTACAGATRCWRDNSKSQKKLTGDQRNSFIAAMLGWTMDAFDYFIVVFVYADIAKTFHISKAEVAFITTATLAMRPVGALLFGLWADRVGRRTPADGGRDLLLGRRLPVRVRAQLHRAGDPAVAVRPWHGRRMGAGRGARHGEGPRRAARLFLGTAAGGLRVRLSAGEPGIAGGDGLAGAVVALVVRLVHHPGADQPDHPVPGAGVRGMGSRPGPDEADQHQNPRRAARRRDHPPVLLPGGPDDRLQLDEPRHPGRLPHVPGGAPPTMVPACPA